MADSNAEWGDLAAHDEELAELWDGFRRLPDAGENAALDVLIERKHLTIGDLVRLGARLADDVTLAFAYPGGIKYRHLVTDARWGVAGSEFKHLKIVRGTDRSRCIVAEGETDGARLSGVYDCDVAVLPGGADPRPHAARYAQQLQGYELVLLGHDDDEAGHSGAAILAELVPQAVRFCPPAGDWCEVTDFPPLPAAPQLERAGGLIFEDLGPMLEGGVPDPEVLVDDLLYTEGVHWMDGHPESGKTTLAMHLSIEVMGGGKHVVWLDYEGGLRQTVRRLIACDCPAQLAIERFHYAAWPTEPVQFFGDVAAKWPGALIVLDSASKAISAAGLDENSPTDVTKWCAPIVKAVKGCALPLIIIDHVIKSATKDSRYSRGAGSKLADSDVKFFVQCVDRFSRTQQGLICVHQQKDREGFLPYETWFKIGDGKGGLTMNVTEAPTDEGPVEERPGDPSI